MPPSPDGPTLDALTRRAGEIARDARPVIDGGRVDPIADSVFDLVNPATGARLCSVPACTDADVDRAVASAQRAWQDGRWAALAPSARAVILHRFADAIAADAQTLGLLDTLQMGMPAQQAIGGIAEAADMVHAAAEMVEAQTDQVMPSAPTALYLQMRRPQGVVAAITPWNYPVHVALAKVAPALATGNCVILKPSEIAPLACLRLAELAAEAGVPPGVFNALPGTGPGAGRALALHHGVDCLAFVGSTATGLQLMQYAGQSNMKRLLLECGGKSPQIVFDDLGDAAGVADAIVAGFTHNSGQICVSGSRIILVGGLYDRLLPLLAERVAALTIGDPLDPETRLGPLASAAQAEKVRRHVHEGTQHAALCASGGDASGAGTAVAPHLFAVADPDIALAQEEIFGPVGAVLRCDDADQAVRLANATRYGLSATIWARDLALAHRVTAQLRAGFVFTYAVAAPSPPGVRYLSGEPFGMSGFGVDGGQLGMQSYTRVQAVGYLMG